MLKGTATIVLTDVKTGKKEVVKHDNLVTNAVNDLLTLNPFGFRFRCYSSNQKNLTDASNQYDELGTSFEAGLLPVCPNLIGGILLYENPLEEDPQKYYADMDNPLVGYSSNDVNSGGDVKRGSMNLTESGPLEDGNGYRFVFDFGTNQANGTISALGMTSARGGKAGYGSEYDLVGYPVLCVDTEYKKCREANSGADDFDYLNEELIRSNILSIDPNTGICYYAMPTDANTITVGKAKMSAANLNLTEGTFSFGVIDEKEIRTNSFAAIYENATNIYNGTNFGRAFCGIMLDGGDGNIWGFQHENGATGNSDGQASILWVKINKEDWTCTEGKWLIDAQICPLGFSGIYTSYQTKNAIIKQNRLYVIRYDKRGVYSFDLDNPADVNLMECDFEIVVAFSSTNVTSSYTTTRFRTNISELNGVVSFQNAYISGGKIHKAGFGYEYGHNMGINQRPSKNKGLDKCAASLEPFGPYKIALCLARYAYSNNTRSYYNCVLIYIMNTYLATINNLDTPVQKTADKTMKITYILREE